MIVKGTAYALEFNARMGDPETQVVLPLLKTDLLEVIEAVVEHRLDQLAVDWHDDTVVCVVMTSKAILGPIRPATSIPWLTAPDRCGKQDFSCRYGTGWHRGRYSRRSGAGSDRTRSNTGIRAS